MNIFGDEDLNSILLGSIPKHNDLCYLMGTINFSTESKTANISNKAYQCQIYKCRCLIFSVPEVIASPVLGAVAHIHIIVSQEYYLSGKLNPHLDKMNIKVQDPKPLTDEVYEACLRYTVLARLAPKWNQVERYLVHGRDFLTSSAPMDAVKLDIVINENDMHLVLLPLRLRLPQVCAQDFHISSPTSPFILDLSASNLSVHVLPSLNRANILLVTSHIPQNSLFKSYKELKRHWKNSYGYRLPESDEGMYYLTVKFGRWFCESLTYPVACVRSRRPVFLRQREPQKVLMELLADLHAKIPYVCGFPFGVDATIRYALPKLDVFNELLVPLNLSTTKPEPERHAETDEDDLIVDEEPSQLVSQYTQTQTSKLGTQSRNRTRSVSPPPFLPQMSPLITTTQSKPAFVPVFTAKPRSTSSSWHQPSSPEPPAEETVRPVFGGTATKPVFGGTTIKPVFGGTTIKPVFGGTPVKHMFGKTPVETMFSASQSVHVRQPTQNVPTSKPTAFFPIFNPNASSSFIIGKGEKTPLHLPDSTSKKVRNKPQVQAGVDVRALAQTRDGLSKVNTTTLIAFLRSEGVPCKVKDKKGELVAKVLNYLKIPQHGTSPPSTEPQASQPICTFYNS